MSQKNHPKHPDKQQFSNISDEEEDEIHILPSNAFPRANPNTLSSSQSSGVASGLSSKRRKEESVFKPSSETEDIQIKIIGYDKQSFLKIQTQIYKIEVRDLKTDLMWIIKRRFSDVQWLYQALSINHIGYITPYFPGKTLESFVTAKLGIGVNKEKKDEFLLERTYQIGAFLHQIYRHYQLKYSEEARVFILRNDSDFISQRRRLDTYIEEYREIETSTLNFLSIIEKGASLLSSYMGSKKLSRQISKQDLEFETYLQKIVEDGNTIKILIVNFQDLQTLKKQEAEFQAIEAPETNLVDVEHESSSPSANSISSKKKIQQINSRLLTGKQHSIWLCGQLNQDIMKPLHKLALWVEQVESQVKYRKQLVELVFSLKQNIQDISRIRKLQRRIQKLENNFRRGWEKFTEDVASQLTGVRKRFDGIWQAYADRMCKIWR